MKRIVAIGLCIIMLSALLCSCQNEAKKKTENVPKQDDINNVKTKPNNVTTENLVVDPVFQTMIYGSYENDTIYHVKGDWEKTYGEKEYTETGIAQSITVNIFGKEYTGIYKNSAQLPRSDTKVRVYTLEGTESGVVMIDQRTNKIVEYVAIPYNASKLKTEADYKKAIENIVNTTGKLSEYDYKSTTHYYKTSEDGIRSQVVDGFKVCEENETIGTYSFYYTKSLGEYKLPDHISVEFYNGFVNVEVYEYGYDISMFEKKADQMKSVLQNAEAYLTKNAKEGVKLKDFKHARAEFFVKNGKVCAFVRTTASYQSQYTGGEWISNSISTISVLE